MAPLSNASFPLGAEVADLIARAAGAAPTGDEDPMLILLHEIIAQRKLTALFQPIVRMRNGEILGYEGLIRGPSNTPLHSPLALFKVARAHQLSVQMEYLCRHIVLTRFAQLGLPGNLFLNVSPGALMHPEAIQGETLRYLENLGVNPQRIIIELTENEPTYDYTQLRNAAMHYRDMGFQIAIDDLGEGFSSLRLWSELQPEYVKVDMHFVQGINNDPMKLQFVRSIQEIAEKSGSVVIAEGIESQAELLTIRDLGIACGQGYHIARPLPEPPVSISEDVTKTLRRDKVPLDAHKYGPGKRTTTAFKLLRETRYVSPEVSNDEVYHLFVNDPQLQALPVVSNGLPIGLINRYSMVERFARLYGRELYGKKSCAFFMDPNPILVEQDTSLQDLSNLLVHAESHHLSNGFIITDRGQYMGLGTGHDLLREITQMQIDAARHANPLTQLPGNVPINDHIEYLLQSGVEFCICYADLDLFKPYNDVYGYRKGDDLIQATGRLLQQAVDPRLDFIGHIGGDDFLIMFQSEDWEKRCRSMLDNFDVATRAFYYDEDRERGGYYTEDRQGNRVFHPLVSLSLGAVKIEPSQYSSPHQIAAAATRAKMQAKKSPGSKLFIERRVPATFSWALKEA